MRRVFSLGLVAWLGFAEPAAVLTKDDQRVLARKSWWSFRPPVRPAVPLLKDPWVRTPVDAFILQGLREKGWTPSPAVSRAQLIRRVSLDVTGLPPAPAEVAAFVADRSPQAYEHLVDRLLASNAYGERWGQKWLDVVRYSDTNGFELDLDRTHAWRYRDYVIRSFNQSKPYDRFLKEQIEPHLENGEGRLDRLKRLAATAPVAERAHVLQRVKQLESWHRRAAGLLPLLIRFLGK